jgi:orotate phosphoribosyltransferase
MEPRRSPNKLETRVKTFNLILERSFRRGKFTLASGKESDFYLDLKPTSLHPEGSNLLAQLILQYIQEKQLSVDAIGGLEMGAVPLQTAVTMVSGQIGRPLPGFIVRKAVKDHGTRRKIETAIDLKGKNVLVLDDVTTTGESAMEAVTAARQVGANVLLVLSMVDRGEGAEQTYQREKIPFDRLFHIREFLAATADQQAS